MTQFRVLRSVPFVLALVPFLCGPASAATCGAQARYVKSEARDGKGFKQAVTIAVAPGQGPSHGLVTYTVRWKDKAGAVQTSTGKNVTYTFEGGAAASGGGGSRAVDETVLDAGACADARPCRVTGATVSEVSCFRDGGGRCAASASFVESSSRDAKGFKQAVAFDVSSADGGAAYHGLVKYTLQWTDKDGNAKSSSKNVPYKGSAGGGAGEILVVDETVLGAGACADGAPCSIESVTVEKVSCFTGK